MARALLVVGILLGMLIVPVWLNKSRSEGEKKLAADKKAAAPAAPTPASAPVSTQVGAAAPSPAQKPIGFGLSFAMVQDSRQPPDTVHFNCHGEPAGLDRPHNGSCNPYQGDTSCRTVLPVLCLKPGTDPQPAGVEAGFYKGWTGGTLSATQPVMGAILSSQAVAHARCEAEFGTGWRMAEFHDARGGWGVQGLRGQGYSPGTRYWVSVNDQPGNCWNSTP